MNISDISNNAKLGQANLHQNNQNVKGESFSQLLKNSVGEINNSQIKAYDTMQAVATGKVANLQEAVQRIEEAELSLKLALEVKNKALNSYKEIMKMTV